jgi:hypothetical protein
VIERNGVRLGWIELISSNFVDRSLREKVDGQKEVETVLRDAQASRVTLLLGGGVKSKTRNNSQILFKTRCQVSSHTSMLCQLPRLLSAQLPIFPRHGWQPRKKPQDWDTEVLSGLARLRHPSNQR